MKKGRRGKCKTRNPSKKLIEKSVSSRKEYNDLKQTIVNAILESQQIERENRLEQEKKELAEWKVQMGWKDYSNSKNLFRVLFQFKNQIVFFLNLMFSSKKSIKGGMATLAFLKAILIIFFNIIRFFLGLFSILAIIYIFCPYLIADVTPLPPFLFTLLVVCVLFLFFVSKVIRIICIEIDKHNDINFVFGIFTSMISLVSLLVAFIAMFKGK